VVSRCACGAPLTRPESIDTGRCLECALTDWDQLCLDCAKPSQTPFCDRCLAIIIDDSRTGDVECWVAVPGYEGSYQVSSFGRLRSLDRLTVNTKGERRSYQGQLIKQRRRRYPEVKLAVAGVKRNVAVHTLVARAFLGPPPRRLEVCHFNDEKTDNRLCNLRWDSRSANNLDRVRNGRDHNANRTRCRAGHVFTPENTVILKRGGRTYRRCRTCLYASTAVSNRKYRQRNLATIRVRQRESARRRRREANS
jgi:hypothetical protein